MSAAGENSAVYGFEKIDFDFDSDFDPEETESGDEEHRPSSGNYLDAHRGASIS